MTAPSAASGHLAPDATVPFTPSELVYLRGTEFAKKSLLGNTVLPTTGAKVDASDLGETMLTAAVLAAEAAGAVRLEVGQRKSLFGLLKWKALEARPTGAPPAWPAGTFEGVVERWARDLEDRGEPPRVQDIVHGFLEQDVANPWEQVMTFTKRGMAARDLAVAEQKKVLKVFSTTVYEVPEATAAQAEKADVEAVRALVAAAERERPELAKLVRTTVKNAVASRQEASDGPD